MMINIKKIIGELINANYFLEAFLDNFPWPILFVTEEEVLFCLFDGCLGGDEDI